jgi:MtfA peptidase
MEITILQTSILYSLMQGPDVSTLIVIFLVAISLLILVSTMFIMLIDALYALVVRKPAFVHFYLFPKRLPAAGVQVLHGQFKFYRNLSEAQKKYFRHRVQAFIDTYKFAGRQGQHITEDMKIKIAGTYVMLTFGMRAYLTSLFETIIVYPDIYESFNGAWHEGEFNPGVKAVVFSWKHFQEGIDFDTNNLNLGLHEFTHVLHMAALNRELGISGELFGDTMLKIFTYSAYEPNRDRIQNTGYLRDYAYTNKHEFMAVILEHFFETPAQFRQQLPELYGMVSTMINFRPKI